MTLNKLLRYDLMAMYLARASFARRHIVSSAAYACHHNLLQFMKANLIMNCTETNQST